MRVLHVAETAKGGVGTYIDEIAPLQAAELGPGSIRALVPDCHAAQLGRIPPQAISTFRRTGRGIANMARLRGALVAEVQHFAPQLIHAHSFFAGLVTRLSLGGTDAPAILYCPHGWAFDIAAPRWQQRLIEIAERLLSRRCDAIVAISRYEAERARRIGIASDSIRTVPNGISAGAPTAMPAGWDDQRLKILFIGRLDRQKGFDILLNAVGDAPDRFCVKAAGAAVADGIDPSLIPANVELLGWLGPGEIEGLLQGADIVAMPSRWEGFGLTALEAMRAGKPVVATRVGGLVEIVEDGVTGRLVAPEDASELRRALLTDDAASRRRLGECGRTRFLDGFTAARTHHHLLNLYAELVERKEKCCTHAAAEIEMEKRRTLAEQP